MAVQGERKATRSAASGSVGDLEAVAKSTNGRIPKAKQKAALAAPLKSKGADNLKANNSAPVTRKGPTSFKGSASSHKKASAKDASKPPKMTQAEQSAEFERVAREHGAEGSEAEFDGVLRKLAKPKAS